VGVVQCSSIPMMAIPAFYPGDVSRSRRSGTVARCFGSAFRCYTRVIWMLG